MHPNPPSGLQEGGLGGAESKTKPQEDMRKWYRGHFALRRQISPCSPAYNCYLAVGEDKKGIKPPTLQCTVNPFKALVIPHHWLAKPTQCFSLLQLAHILSNPFWLNPVAIVIKP